MAGRTAGTCRASVGTVVSDIRLHVARAGQCLGGHRPSSGLHGQGLPLRLGAVHPVLEARCLGLATNQPADQALAVPDWAQSSTAKLAASQVSM
eukprot:scaffold122_cov387-Prasinococcus_capsulatus_cf.AAC.6